MSFLKNRYNDVRVVWKILSVLLVFFMAVILFRIVLSVCYTFAALSSGITNLKVLAEKMMNDEYLSVISGIVQNVLMIFSVILFWKLFDKKPLKDMGLSSVRHGLKDMAYGLIAGAVSISVIFFILLLAGQIYVTNDFLKPNISWFLLADLVMMIFVGFGEEIFSRGYCMSIMKRSNIILVYILPNVIFALLHISNTNVSILPLVNIFLIGILFSLMFIRRGNIWMPIGYHITWNYFQGSVFGLPVSGIDVNGLYTSKLVSENIFNGGGFGPEGGLLVTLLIIASIILFFVFTKSKTIKEPVDIIG